MLLTAHALPSLLLLAMAAMEWGIAPAVPAAGTAGTYGGVLCIMPAHYDSPFCAIHSSRSRCMEQTSQDRLCHKFGSLLS
jgi:hypothetical protein